MLQHNTVHATDDTNTNMEHTKKGKRGKNAKKGQNTRQQQTTTKTRKTATTNHHFVPMDPFTLTARSVVALQEIEKKSPTKVEVYTMGLQEEGSKGTAALYHDKDL
jgi:hypothetical protein